MGDIQVPEEKKLWLLGVYNESITDFIVAAFMSFQYCIWEQKLRKNVPSFNTIYTEFLELFRSTCSHSQQIRLSGSELNYALCRNVFGPRRGVHDE
jgi:hypothetical protein